ncbi:hypothetical protein HU200_009113 [Digitaria exilis]|uniref:Uncharacterized protein n=1 Tax=Digitaria exilis TaxID=1010633 RepID=A0A835FJR4_9POAL|nr:hypothetical protein HU200_009113 [Digitaria exilis]
MLLLAVVPAVAAGGFLQTFQLAFLLWPFNAMLPLARDLPRACITLRGIASFYAAGLHAYVSGARRGAQLMQARRHLLQGDAGVLRRRLPRSQQHASPRGVQQRTHGDLVAHAMVALVDISY